MHSVRFCGNDRFRNKRKPITQQTWISDKRECPVPQDDERCKMHQVKVRNVYPGYNECSNKNDLAVLEMSSDLPRKHLAPICMPTQWEKLSRVLQVAGSGNTIPEKWGYKTDGYNVVNTILKSEGNGEIETKTPKDAAVCGGDSGGPLFQRNIYSKQTLVGIFSSGDNCTEHGSVDSEIHTDVRKFLPWICNVTGVCYTLYDEERAGRGIWFTSHETFVTFERRFGDELGELPE
ncbi:unnamed protein product [Nippostrongylus brasiliensis]|uniref:Peptidase S1 domain-containing protein n=1 Tax=Nippostrongylus brasiliensis TaxID=27835 RepID=A0A158QZ04_NIPBR|nr:unnamed protein product [Nippostrongylus brasiliensis]